MRTAAQELSLTTRFEADRRERAAPLVIVLDNLVLPFFIGEGCRGSLCSRFTVLCEDGKVSRWTSHCKNACGLRSICRENHLIGQQCQTFAKNRFVPEQKVAAIDHRLTSWLFCGTVPRCDATCSAVVSATLLSGVLICALLLFDCILEVSHVSSCC
jgi:hypothetical protein